ncbi:WD domain, G-beta repeat [Aquisphaera giovannonii]|uniref:WD domain, G-beta repeat n=1 Tax=Aquisphaera giovannonii TaxID=406548 RepID=A0A5B9WD72_9BACT|nr:AAA family ATPase [Aquisphaera giovannonii]QEH38433.1 WD domain, G-beta repeat [Aquisphaera giovannonii]
MSEIVCQVDNRADAVELVWSAGGGFFEPYAISGTQLAELRAEARKARDALERLVLAHNEAGSGPPPWEPSFDLATAGFRLYRKLLPGGDRTALKVRGWLAGLRARPGPGPLGLEVVVEERAADPATFLGVPWNLVYDEDPDDREEAFRTGGSAERWRPFWAIRYALTTGRRVEPWQRAPAWDEPRVLAVIDPTVYEALREDQRRRLDAFLAGGRVARAGSLKELRASLKGGYPRLLYWLGHATPEHLRLGPGEPIRPGQLRDALDVDDRERPDGMLAFLNACRTAESGSGESFLNVLHSFGFTGAIATERQTIDNFANEFGLDFLEGFLRDGKPLGELLHELRLKSAPLGLLYGAHCPPEIRVRRRDEPAGAAGPAIRESGRVAGVSLDAGAPAIEAGPVRGSAPADLPERPYRSLACYDEPHRALFTGRDADVVRFAATLDRPDTRIMVLHGESGLGKSSFLRAGLIPYLERDCVGYRFFRRPDGSPLIVQAARDLVGQLAQALLDASAAPLRYDTPDGDELVVDLRPAIDEALGAPADQPGLREALRRDVHLLANLLARMAGRLPHALVLVLDQAEEVFTLVRPDEPEEVAARDHALRMLQRAVDVRADVKLIVSLRTEYYGRLLDHLRAGRRDLVGVRDDLLRDFGRAALVEAITRPTSEESLAGGGPSPREAYGFRYAKGVPERIAGGVLALRSENQDSVLPLVQVICTQLFERLAGPPGAERVITGEDLDAIGGVDGGLKAFAEGALARTLRLSPGDRRAFRGLFSQLYLRQPDGTLSTRMIAREDLERQWGRPAPFAGLLEAARSARLLREDQLRLQGDEPRGYIRLGHDALAKVAAAWDDDLKRRGRRRKLLAAVAGSLALAGIMSVLALAAWQSSLVAEDRRLEALRNAAVAEGSRRQAQLTAANLTLDRGLSLCEQDDVAGGLSWMAHSLKIVPRDAPAVEGVIRANLRAWIPHLPRLRHIFPHGLDVRSVAFSPDGRLALTGSFDGTARLWDVETGDEPRTLTHPEAVEDVAFSHDGSTFATACKDGKARIWDATSLELRGELAHAEPVMCLAFSRDGNTLLTGVYEGWAYLWDIGTGRQLCPRLEHGDWIRAVAFTADGRHAVTACWDTRVRTWDARTGAPSGLPIVTNNSSIMAMAVSDEDRTVLVGGMDGYARRWSLETGELIREYGPHRGAVYAVAVRPDDRTRVVTGSNDGSVREWESGTGRPLGTLCRHSGWVTSLAFHPKEPILLTGSGDRTARLWDLTPVREALATMPHSAAVRNALFSPDRTAVLTVGEDKKAHSWDISQGIPRDRSGPVGGPAMDLALDRSWNVIAVAAGNDVRFLDARTLESSGASLSHGGSVISLAMSRDGARVVTACFDQILRVWDVEARACVAERRMEHYAGDVAMHPDGKSFLVNLANVVKRLDAATLLPVGPDLVHPANTFDIACHPDGRTIATACAARKAYIWKAGPGGHTPLSLPHPADVLGVAFSPDGDLLLTGCFDNSARLWDVSTGKPIGKPFRHEAGVLSVCFSPDGATVLTTSFDKTARLWKVPNRTLDGSPDEVVSWVEGLTGLEFRGEGDLRVLDDEPWKHLQSRIPEELRAGDR